MTANTLHLPGTPRHQAIQRAILQAFADDTTILTIGVFGSTVRPDCDEWSDIDLDVLAPAEHVTRAQLQIQHLANYLNAHGFPTLLVVWDGEDNSAEILLESLDRIDITIHAPETSKSEVLPDLILIRGDAHELPKSGRPALTANDAEHQLRYLHDKMPIVALYVAISLRREELWGALMLLQHMRESIMDIYGLTRGSTLPKRHFMKHAEKDLQDALGETLTTYEADSIKTGLRRMMSLYRNYCDQISNGRLRVSEAQAAVFERVETLL